MPPLDSIAPTPSAPAPHVREVAPHAHDWREVGRVHDEVYEACSACGARRGLMERVNGAREPMRQFAVRARQRRWLAGGDWIGPDGGDGAPAARAA